MLLRWVVGDRLRRVRIRRGWALRFVAARAGVSLAYLFEIERGRKEPSSEVLDAVRAALDLELLDLVGLVDAELRRSAGSAGPRRGDVSLAA